MDNQIKAEKVVVKISPKTLEFLNVLLNQKDFSAITAEQATSLIYILKFLPSKK